MIEVQPYDPFITKFIADTFDMYNGVINKTNLAHLEINWCRQPMSSIAGFSTLLNVVVINPMVEARYCPGWECYYVFILEHIVHELYHTDQVIEFKKMRFTDYCRRIEYAVEEKTSEFMLKQLPELKRIWKIPDEYYNPIREFYIANYDNAKQYNCEYVSRTYADMIWMMIDIFTDPYQDTSGFREAIKGAVDTFNDLVLHLPMDVIVIQDRKTNFRIDLMDLCAIANKYYADYIVTKANVHLKCNEDGSVYIKVSINSICKNMCIIDTGRR